MWIVTDHPPASQVFTQFYDGGGWGSYGLATLVGIGTPLWCFVGPDAGAHMSEELKDASLQLPRAMMWATFFNGVLGVRKCHLELKAMDGADTSFARQLCSSLSGETSFGSHEVGH